MDHGKGYFWGRIWGTPLSKGLYSAYVCYSAAIRPFSQFTFGRLVIRLLADACKVVGLLASVSLKLERSLCILLASL